MRLIFKCVFPFSARIMLLCHFKGTLLEKYSEIATNLLAASESLIAQKRKDDKPPLWNEWVGKVWHVFLICKLTVVAHFYMRDRGAMDTLGKQWSVYADFINKPGSGGQIRSQILELL